MLASEYTWPQNGEIASYINLVKDSLSMAVYFYFLFLTHK